MKKLKVALVHDYLNEFGGAERVLLSLSEIYPDAPIYTSFYRKKSNAYKSFKDKKIIASWAHKYVPFFRTGKLHSPLRFLTPLIWNSFDFSGYDLIISSSSWYITRGFVRKGRAVEICYCHTPPRWLYGLPTSVNFQKYWPVRVYALIVGHFIRMYDFSAAQRVDYFISNSKNVSKRIFKFYKRESVVIYPPVDIKKVKISRGDFYLVLSRIVGAKGIELAVEASKKLGFKLVIAGEPAGYSAELEKIKSKAGKNVTFLGYVTDAKRAELYSSAKGFLALATDEDFGITPVEAMMAGTPVVAFAGGGYLESVIEGKTGVFFSEPTVESLCSAIMKFEKSNFSSSACVEQANKFSKERFRKEILDFVEEKLSDKKIINKKNA